MSESPELLNTLIDTATQAVEVLQEYLQQVTEGINSEYCQSTCEHILFKLKTLYAPIPESQYDKCWKGRVYQPDLDCEGCPHRYGCSEYEGESDE